MPIPLALIPVNMNAVDLICLEIKFGFKELPFFRLSDQDKFLKSLDGLCDPPLHLDVC